MRGCVIVCRTLGPVDVSVNDAGAPPALLWRKNLALLVYLARSPKRARTREHLIGLLWADKPEEDARHSLNEAVRTLRRYLGEGGLESDGNQVRLGAGAVEPDTDRLDARVAGPDYEAAGALAQFQAFAAHLTSEMGTEPADETKALAERIRRERVWRLPPGRATGEEVAATQQRAPLVGRAAELERLLEVWGACRRKRCPAVVILEGDAGTGKTRLAEELMDRARLEGAATVAVRAVEADSHEPWSGLHGIARGGLLEAPGVAGAAPPALAALRAGRAPAGPLGATAQQVLRAVAEEHPLVVLVDDAQWLDRESLLALGAVARDLTQSPLFLLLTVSAQPPRAELDALRVRIGRELLGAVVSLESLSSDALRALARWALPGYSEVELDRVTRRVATDSAGIPLLAVELLRAVAAGLDLRDSPGAWPEPFRTLDQTLPGDLPDAVVAAIRIGFRRLSPGAQRVLAVAAVLGGRVARPRLERGSGLDADALAAALDELEWQRWLTAEPRGAAVVAGIVREGVERGLLTPGQRQRTP